MSRYFAHRIPLWLTMWWSLMLVPNVPGLRLRPHNDFLDGWFRWESISYIHISEFGYTNIADDVGQQDTHYWPMLPILERLVSYLFGGDTLLGAWFLNNGLLLGSVILFDDFARRHLDEKTTRLAGWLLLAYPFSFYYSAGHTESALLFFALLTLYFGYRKQWLLAGLAAALAGAMRASGLAVGAALGVLYLEHIEWSPRKIRPNAIFACLGALGPLGYATFLKMKFGDALAFTHGLQAKHWGAEITFARFIDVLTKFLVPWRWAAPSWRDANDAFHIVCLFAAIGLTIAGIRRFKLHVTVFAALTILIQVRLWANSGRYVAPIFPLYVVAASHLESRPNLTFFVLSASFLFTGLYVFLYGHGFWVS